MALSLLILAAGMGSRYGGLKQIAPVGAQGEMIIDYSIYDAIRAGCSQIVLVIRREHESEFRKIFTARYSAKITLDYAFQDLNDLPAGFTPPRDREKPWGTGQAVYAARNLIKQPFIMINADDFYGADSYRVVADYLQTAAADQYCLAGYKLSATLSPNGTVSRGVCAVDERGFLVAANEMTQIARGSDGKIFNLDKNGARQNLIGDEAVSMNLFGFTPSLFAHLSALFTDFLQAHGDETKSEFYIPYAVNSLIAQRQATLKVLPTTAQWLGLTYQEDRAAIMDGIATLTRAGIYPPCLWG